MLPTPTKGITKKLHKVISYSLFGVRNGTDYNMGTQTLLHTIFALKISIYTIFQPKKTFFLILNFHFEIFINRPFKQRCQSLQSYILGFQN